MLYWSGNIIIVHWYGLYGRDYIMHVEGRKEKETWSEREREKR